MMTGQKLNADTMKRENRSRVLRLIRSAPLTRADLSRLTGLTTATITLITAELLQEGVIREGIKQKPRGGRPGVVLTVNPAHGFFGGVHISRTGYTVGVCDFVGNPIAQRSRAVDPDDANRSLKDMCDTLAALIGDERFTGIGIAAPGPLDRHTGKLGDVANFPDWQHRSVVDGFAARFGCPVVLDNYSNALALAEYAVGTVQKKRYLELIVDAGFGSSVVHIDGDAVRLIDCELGHTTVDIFGARCDCGNYGCAELYVNERTYRGSDAARERFYRALCAVVVGAVNAFHIEEVVFAGAVLDGFEEFRDRLFAMLSARLRVPPVLTPTRLTGKEVFTAGHLCIE